jgi:hypothetical protein
MAFENLFIRTQKAIGDIQLDAVISEAHTNKVSLTSNPVELDAEITDHAVVQPKQINILAEVSDTPLRPAAFGQIVDLVTGLFGSSTSENITRSNATYNALIQLQEEREPIEIQTKLKLYTKMIITNISVKQDKNTSRIVRMSIDLQQVIITQSEIVQLTEEQLRAGSAKEQASPAEKSGRKEAVEPSAATNKSFAKILYDWIVGP